MIELGRSLFEAKCYEQPVESVALLAQRYEKLKRNATRIDPDGNKYIYQIEIIAYNRESFDEAVEMMK